MLTLPGFLTWRLTQTWQLKNPLSMKALVGKSHINGGFSSKPCLTAGVYLQFWALWKGKHSFSTVDRGVVRNEKHPGRFHNPLQIVGHVPSFSEIPWEIPWHFPFSNGHGHEGSMPYFWTPPEIILLAHIYIYIIIVIVIISSIIIITIIICIYIIMYIYI